jgi:hypothetical protein
MVITGDIKQTHRSVENGLLDIINKIKAYKTYNEASIELVEMKYSDIERSPIVSKILEIFNNKPGNISFSEPLITTQEPIVEKNNTSNIMEIVDKKNKRADINNDAALIPLSDMSRHFNSPDNTNLYF